MKEADLAESEAEAKTATLMTSKTAEVDAAGKAIETKTAQSGLVAEETAQAKADLGSTERAVAEDIGEPA